jgi:hypothetical protein
MPGDHRRRRWNPSDTPIGGDSFGLRANGLTGQGARSKEQGASEESDSRPKGSDVRTLYAFLFVIRFSRFRVAVWIRWSTNPGVDNPWFQLNVPALNTHAPDGY